MPSNFFSSNQWSEFSKLDYFIGKSTQWAQIWSEIKLRSLDTIWTHFVSKFFANTCIFSKLKSYLVLTGAQCNCRRQTGMCRFTKSHTKITYYFILWFDTEIGKILCIKTWMLQKKIVWPKSIKTKLWQPEYLVNRYVFPFVMFMISTYCDSMDSWLICFSV